jgi:hypothetical protein
MTTTGIRERPILFSAPMIQAIRAGHKSVTRRVITPQPPPWVESFGYTAFTPPERISGRGRTPEHGPCESFFECPYGLKGDRLWVRESFYVAEPYSWGTDPSGEPIIHQGVPRGPVHYAADGLPANTPNSHYPTGLRGGAISAPDPYAVWRCRPSIHMPRWASRITLEIKSVRVERVQEIDTLGALDEGFEGAHEIVHGIMKESGKEPRTREWLEGDPRDEFALLWDKLNGNRNGGIYSWTVNPWVWIVCFAVVKAGE